MCPSDDTPNLSSAHDAAATFQALMTRLEAGDEAAAAEVHRRMTPRLVALARRHLETTLRGKVDPESVVQSVYRSFFRRQAKGQFTFGAWHDLWGLLTIITLRKVANRRRYHRQERRDVKREVPLETFGNEEARSWQLVDPEPSPEDAALLTETLERLLEGLTDRERQIIELLLQGHTVEEVRVQVACGERTVRRMRDRVRQKLRTLHPEE